jgi:tRNA 2-(methylsulfanyl)-N6-isopentenyladenosine37 hydroxylase
MQHILETLPLKIRTQPEWVDAALGNVDAFLADHASCERKAHSAALMLVNKFHGYPMLQDQLIGLAREELEHFHQVFRILRERGVSLVQDEVDSYVKALLRHVRHPQSEHLLDRLLVAALIEARSCERFCIFAAALPPGALKDFYVAFAEAESAHFPLFVGMAKEFAGQDVASRRLEEWLELEARVMAEDVLGGANAAGYRATVH